MGLLQIISILKNREETITKDQWDVINEVSPEFLEKAIRGNAREHLHLEAKIGEKGHLQGKAIHRWVADPDVVGIHPETEKPIKRWKKELETVTFKLEGNNPAIREALKFQADARLRFDPRLKEIHPYNMSRWDWFWELPSKNIPIAAKLLEEVYPEVSKKLLTSEEFEDHRNNHIAKELEYNESRKDRPSYLHDIPKGKEAERLGQDYFPYQKAGIEYVTRRKNSIIGDEQGLGKENPYDTKILTPYGWIQIGDLQVDDDVTRSDGKVCTVTGVFPQGIKPVYRVTFSDGSGIEAGDEHLWTVAYWVSGKHLQDSVLTTKQLRERPIIDMTWEHGTHRHTKLDLSKTALYLPMLSSPAEFVSDVDLPIDPYCLGQLIANGNLKGCTPVITCNAQDLPEIKTRLDEEFVNTGITKIYNGVGRISIIGITQDIRNLKLNVLSKDKFIPRIYLEALPEERIVLLQGLMDSDGSISKTDCKVTYHTLSKQLASDVQELVEGLGGIASIREYDRSAEDKPLEYQVRVRTPLNIAPFSIERKLSRWNPKNRASPWRTVVSVEYTRDTECVCIAVDAPDKLYVTEHCILTHNTSQAIGACNIWKPERVMIACPASLKLNWLREWKRWNTTKELSRITVIDPGRIVTYENGKERVLSGYEELKKISDEHGVLIINYDALGKYKDVLQGVDWDVQIADEFQKCKNPKAGRTRALLGGKAIVDKERQNPDGTYEVIEPAVDPIPAKHKLFLSGTPIMNKIREIWPALKVLDNEGSESLGQKFGKYFKRGTYQWQFTGKFQEFQEALRSRLMVRRLKDDVLDLPPKMWNMVEIEPDAKAEAALKEDKEMAAKYTEYLEELAGLEAKYAEASVSLDDTEENALKKQELVKHFNTDASKLKGGRGIPFERISEIRHRTAVAKLLQFNQFMLDTLENLEEGKKVIIFAHHKDVIGGIEQFLDAYNQKNKKDPFEYRTVDGETKMSDRQKYVDEFQQDKGGPRVFIGNILAAGVGLTLTKADTVMFAEMDWTPGGMDQAADRAHRIGQKNSVSIYNVVFDGTLDARMAQLIEEKRAIIQKALDEKKKDKPKTDEEILKENLEKQKEQMAETKTVDEEDLKQAEHERAIKNATRFNDDFFDKLKDDKLVNKHGSFDIKRPVYIGKPGTVVDPDKVEAWKSDIQRILRSANLGRDTTFARSLGNNSFMTGTQAAWGVAMIHSNRANISDEDLEKVGINPPKRASTEAKPESAPSKPAEHISPIHTDIEKRRDQISAIQSALQTLADLDPDRAREINNQGFNKFHGDRGKHLAVIDLHSEPLHVQEEAYNMVRFYYRQIDENTLARAGITPKKEKKAKVIEESKLAITTVEKPEIEESKPVVKVGISGESASIIREMANQRDELPQPVSEAKPLKQHAIPTIRKIESGKLKLFNTQFPNTVEIDELKSLKADGIINADIEEKEFVDKGKTRIKSTVSNVSLTDKGKAIAEANAVIQKPTKEEIKKRGHDFLSVWDLKKKEDVSKGIQPGGIQIESVTKRNRDLAKNNPKIGIPEKTLIDLVKSNSNEVLEGWSRKMKIEGGEHPFSWCVTKAKKFADDPEAFCGKIHSLAFGKTPMEMKEEKKG